MSPGDGYGKALCWIRRDLRLSDHRALAEATRRAGKVAVVFVYDTKILGKLPDRDDRRLTFIHDSLDEVDEGLRAAGSALLARHGDPVEEIPRLAAQLGAEAVFTNHDDDPYALSRDDAVRARLSEAGRDFHTFKDCVVFERQEVMRGGNEPYRVFTPYSRAWRAALGPQDIQEFRPCLARLWPAQELAGTGNLSLEDVGFQRSDLWLSPGESAARARLSEFLHAKVSGYVEGRNRLDVEGTSGLSVHLRHGTVSIRECVRRARANGGEGAEKWLTELIWRDFYHMVLANFPEVVTESFRPEYRQLNWPGRNEHYEVWRKGMTGYPIVDAAMRCLEATGWMHNRLRMVTAMFLTKDLLVDYRLGETYFAQKLLDYELASNNGGWQWSASTGVDAQPYFRVFNPVLQSKKFDPDGVFIKRWCPELDGFSPSSVHFPAETTLLEQQAAGCVVGEDYPAPIVDHAAQRDKAVALFRASK